MSQNADIVCKIGLTTHLDGSQVLCLEKLSARKCGLASLITPVIKKTETGQSILFAIISPKPAYDLFVLTPEMLELAKESYDFTFVEYRIDPAKVSLSVTPEARAYITNLKLTTDVAVKSRTFVEKPRASAKLYDPVEPEDLSENNDQSDPEERELTAQAMPPVIRKATGPKKGGKLANNGSGVATSYLAKNKPKCSKKFDEVCAAIDNCGGAALLGLAKRHSVKGASKMSETELRSAVKETISSFWKE